MTAFHVQCPGCRRRLQVTEDLLGRQAICPHCQAVMVVPETIPASPDRPAQTTDTMRHACPHCQGLFLATVEMAGNPLQCPHCHGSLMVPVASTTNTLSQTPASQTPTPPTPTPQASAPPTPEVSTSKAPTSERPISPPESMRDSTSPTVVPESVALDHDASHASKENREEADQRSPSFTARSNNVRGEDGGHRNTVSPESNPLVIEDDMMMVRWKNQQRQIRRLPDSEKSRRHLIRNLMFAGIGVVILVITLLLMQLR